MERAAHPLAPTHAAALVAAIEACRACEPHLPRGARPVVRLAASARLLIVGQAPGTRVHETGIPWNDPSGDRLRDWLALDRATFYDETRIAIAPMGFCYPGKGPGGDLPPRPECAALWRAPLHAALTQVRLTLLIGSFALRYYLGARQKRTLGETIRARHEYPGYFPLVHPSPRNTRWLKQNPWFATEVLPLARQAVASVLTV